MKKKLVDEIRNSMINYNRISYNFLDFVKDSFEKIMFYHKEDKKVYKGYCSCGAENIPLEKPKSGHYIICPACGKRVKLKNDVYKGRNSTSKVCTYVDKLNDGYIQIIYIGTQRIEYNPTESPKVKVYVSLSEEQRDFLDKNLIFYQYHPQYQYKFIEGGWQKSGKWIKGRAHKHGMGWNGWYSEDVEMFIYPFNLEDIVKDDNKFKYSGLKLFAQNIGYNPLWYLKQYLKYPQVEKLLKVGLYKVAFYLIDNNDYYLSKEERINKDGKTIEAICGLKQKSDLKIAAQYNLTPVQIKALIKMNNWKSEKTFERIKFIANLIMHSGSDFEYPFISNEKLCLYYEKNKGKRTASEFIRDYTDYITAAIALKMNVEDTKVKTPHDFTYCHDICIARYEELLERKRKIQEAKRRRTFKKLSLDYDKIFSCEEKKYSIVVPLTKEDLIKEGEQNKNCVGGYDDRIADGYSIVLFLRETKNKEQSFCTVELNPKTYKIIQCRFYDNDPAPENARKWLEKYIEKIKLKIKLA